MLVNIGTIGREFRLLFSILVLCSLVIFFGAIRSAESAPAANAKPMLLVSTPSTTNPLQARAGQNVTVELVYTAPTTDFAKVEIVNTEGTPVLGTTQYVNLNRTTAVNTPRTILLQLPPEIPAGLYGIIVIRGTAPEILAYEADAIEVIGDPVPTTTKSDITVHFIIDRQERWVNGVYEQIDTAPELAENSAMLPIRHLAEPLGWNFEWIVYETEGIEYRMTVITKGDTHLRVWIGHPAAQISYDRGKTWQNLKIDPENPKVTPLIMGSGRTMLPLRFVAESLGSTVDYDQSSRTITVRVPGPTNQ